MSLTDAKTDRILDAALPVFCQYGYRKTSMQDIATAAGISRAALYLKFSSKDDVFRAGSIRAHQQSMAAVDAALVAPAGTFERIHAALQAFSSGLMAEIAASPHGSELFDASIELVGDVVQQAREDLTARLANTLREAESTGEISLSLADTTPEHVATLLLATLDGLKHAQATDDPTLGGLALQLRLIQRCTAARPAHNGSSTGRE